ncbi:MAG: hypothetical protein QNI84_16450 [Henriciella sp.]|nr:hypothetical protein [Henriciella sp.]
MKGTAILLLGLWLLPAMAAAEINRSQAVSWKADGERYRTEISTRADNGCKRMTYSRAGLEVAGHDCNCDLIIDGREYDHAAPPEGASSALKAICTGPEADPATYSGAEAWIAGR